MLQSFRSHAEQDYPDFELIFGVSDASDPPARQCANCNKNIRPRHQVDHLRTSARNQCQSQQSGADASAAAHEVLFVNDSDIRVQLDYLQQVVAPLADPQVGLVTCLYRAEPAGTIGSRLETLSIATDFVPGVLTAKFLENGLHFGLGSTLAFRRDDLAAIGGFESILDYLADDYELGRRIAATGKRVELSPATVTTFLPAYTLSQFWQHQLRWSRTIRDARLWGYAGLIFTFGLPWSIATLIASRGAPWAWILFAMTYTARLAVGLITATPVLKDRHVLRNVFWLPLRDLIAPIVWAAGLVGNRIHWRGDDFYLKDGKLSKITP